MITHLELHRWKCFRELKLDPRRVTIFIGKNGTGKSSVLQALACLKQSVGGNSLVTNANVLALGTIRDVSSGQVTEETIEFRLRGARQVGRVELIGLSPGMVAQYEYSVLLGSSVLDHSASVTAESLRLEYSELPPTDTTYTLRISEVFASQVNAIIHPGRTIGQPFTLVGYVETPDKVTQPLIQKVVRELVELISWEVKSIRLVPPLRGFTEVDLQLREETDKELPTGISHPNLSVRVATAMVLEEELNARLPALLGRITGVGFAARPRERHQVRVEIRRGKLRVGVVNEGFGTNQLTWLLTVVALAEEHGIVLIEEPEIHLHPKAQAELMQVLVEEAKARDLQLMLTTHSEHILYKVLTLVAKGELTPDEVAVYEFDLDEEGVGHAELMEITERGQIKGGLKGFFDVTLEEMDEYTKALFSRKR